VGIEHLFSDHRYIEFTITLDCPPAENITNLRPKSTDTALHSLVSSIGRGFRNKEYSLAAFLDIEGALNNVTPTAITGALTELGIERPIVGLIHTMLTSRVVYSTIGMSGMSAEEPHKGAYSHLF